MTQEEFEKQIELPLSQFIADEDMLFWERIHIKAAIGRTLMLALRYPNLAQEYLDRLPKTAMD